MKDKKLLGLVRKAAAGDKDAFNALCNQKAREVIYLCTLEMRNPHDGEDAAQEVFIRMQRSITSLQAPEAFNVWLNRLIRNTCLNMKRGSMKHKDAISMDAFDDSFWQDDDQLSLPQEYMEDAEKRKIVAEVIEELPEKYRTSILLHYYQSLSYAQIAEVMDISVDAVNNNMRMARKHMKLELEERLAEPRETGKLVPLMACGPLLALSLQEAAAVAVPSALVSSCLAAAGLGAAALQVGAASAGAGVTAQTVIPIVLSVALVASAAGVALRYAPERMEAPASIVQPAEERPEDGLVVDSGAEAPSDAAGAVPVAGRVWLMAGEGVSAGFPDVTLTLVDAADGTEYQSVQSAADGTFSFGKVACGTAYRLRATLPAYGQPKARSFWVELGGEGGFTPREDSPDAYAGLDIEVDMSTSVKGRITLTLGDRQLAYENQALPGVRVLLLDAAGNTVAETTAQGDGTYEFENPLITEAGTYTVRVLVDEAALGVDTELVIEDRELELYPGYRG